MTTHAKFNIGEIVRHRDHLYRGVIVDVDPDFKGADEIYERAAVADYLRDEPWYHILVDERDEVTYVAEESLETDPDGDPIDHPMLDEFLNAPHEGKEGRYIPRYRFN